MFLDSGTPQGSSCSCLVFILFVGDLPLWIGDGTLGAYADDVFVTVEANDDTELRSKLEEEGENILRYFASNQLVANASKTALVVFGSKSHEPFKITLSNEAIIEMEEEKLLGITVQSDLKFTRQFDRVTTEANYALSTLKRLRQHLGNKELRTIADGLVMSKLRYGLQVFAAASLRLNPTDPQSTAMQRIQRCQNDMLRIVTGNKRRDHVRIEDMLSETRFLSVNQTAAYSLLIEMWKAREFSVPYLDVLLEKRRLDDRTLRSDSANKVTSTGNDTIALNIEKLWNAASEKFKKTNLVKVAKSEARALARTLPV